MKLILFLCVSLLFSCQTPQSKKTRGKQKSVPVSIKALQLNKGSEPNARVQEICVKVDNCASGYKTQEPICARSGASVQNLRLPIGDVSCRLKLVSFLYRFPAWPDANPPRGEMDSEVTLSPDQRDRLADAAVDESIQLASMNDARFSFTISASEILPALIPNSTAVDVSFRIQTSQRGPEAEEVQLKDPLRDQYRHFLEVCEENPHSGASEGEKNLMSELRARTWGLSCQDMISSLLQTTSLTLRDRHSGDHKTLDYALLVEFPNIVRIDIDGFVLHLLATLPLFEVTLGESAQIHLPADISNALDLTVKGKLSKTWLKPPLPAHGIQKLTLDHVKFSDGERSIMDYLGAFQMGHLVLQNVVHENYEGLENFPGTLKISKTNIYDDDVLGPIVTNPKANITMPSTGPADSVCNPILEENECVYGQCVWVANQPTPNCESPKLQAPVGPKRVKCTSILDRSNCTRRHQCVWSTASHSCNFGDASIDFCTTINLKWKCRSVNPQCQWDDPLLHPHTTRCHKL